MLEILFLEVLGAKTSGEGAKTSGEGAKTSGLVKYSGAQ
jgi:hypothetical protein